MKIKCGTDIIEVNRIKEVIQADEKRFLNRVFTDQEIAYCKSKKKMQYQHYAARFAAKEAVFKAISESLPNKYAISWKNIEIKNDKQGKPYVEFIGIDVPNIISMDVSLSHLADYAIANCSIIFQ